MRFASAQADIRAHTRCMALLCMALCFALAACAAPTGAATHKTAGHTPTAGAPDSTAAPDDVSAEWHMAPGSLVINAGSHASAPGQLAQQGPAGYAFAPSNPQIGYACVGVGASTTLYTTHDGGAHWSKLTPAPFPQCADVFLDAQNANDVFATQVVTYGSGAAGQFSNQLWRSQDGGVTWRKLSTPPTGYAFIADQVAVVGTRLLLTAAPSGMATPTDLLYSSDDGGATWHALAQNLASARFRPALFSVMDTTIYIANTGDSSAIFQRSTDGGVTWSRVTFPASLPIFVASQNGGGYYALSEQLNPPSGASANFDTASFWWSADGGVTWRKLPALQGAAGGYVIGGGDVVALASDGAVYSVARHNPQSSGNDAGIYTIQPTAAAPVWRPFAASGAQPDGTSWWQAVQTSSGVRLWGIANDPSGQQSYLEYAAPR